MTKKLANSLPMSHRRRGIGSLGRYHALKDRWSDLVSRIGAKRRLTRRASSHDDRLLPYKFLGRLVGGRVNNFPLKFVLGGRG